MGTPTTGQWPAARARNAAGRPRMVDRRFDDNDAASGISSVSLRLITWVALGSASWLMLWVVSVLLVGAVG